MFQRQPIDEAEDYDDDGWNVTAAATENDDDDDQEDDCAVKLPESFKAEINRIIQDEFDGVCIVKLNWSSPRVRIAMFLRDCEQLNAGFSLDDWRTQISQC